MEESKIAHVQVEVDWYLKHPSHLGLPPNSSFHHSL